MCKDWTCFNSLYEVDVRLAPRARVSEVQFVSHPSVPELRETILDLSMRHLEEAGGGRGRRKFRFRRRGDVGLVEWWMIMIWGMCFLCL